MDYRTIAQPVEAAIEQKKSEFIAALFPVQTAQEAQTQIERIRKTHHKARHHCYAYILRDGSARYSDDGEPQGTAGQPIQGVLKSNRLSDVCCVVTRYFGGVLLGANGLVRAYSAAAAQAAENAQIQTMCACTAVDVRLDYTLYGKVSFALPEQGILQHEPTFDDAVTLHLLVQVGLMEQIERLLTNLTGGQMLLTYGAQSFADFGDRAIMGGTDDDDS